jgi:carbamoyltransferase
LNPLLVNAVEKGTGFEQLFVQPAAGNEGCAAGAAWLVWHQLLRKPRLEPIGHVYWGPQFSNEETKRVLDNCKTSYRWFDAEDPLLDETVRLLETGKIVAWYQGAAEFGPRALGNRNLLALPWAPYVKENLNDYVKHRETFRPFALAVPDDDAHCYFECSGLANFMTSMASVRAEYRELVQDFVLPGNRVRLHVVEARANPTFWRLLKRVGKRSVAPLLVSTSFNLFGEPLVIRPREAVRTFYCSGIDALVVGRFLLRKS